MDNLDSLSSMNASSQGNGEDAAEVRGGGSESEEDEDGERQAGTQGGEAERDGSRVSGDFGCEVAIEEGEDEEGDMDKQQTSLLRGSHPGAEDDECEDDEDSLHAKVEMFHHEIDRLEEEGLGTRLQGLLPFLDRPRKQG